MRLIKTFGIHQTEDPRLIVPRLRTRRYGTNFNGAKTHGAERINALAVLVQPSGQTQRILNVRPMQVTGLTAPSDGPAFPAAYLIRDVIVEK